MPEIDSTGQIYALFGEYSDTYRKMNHVPEDKERNAKTYKLKICYSFWKYEVKYFKGSFFDFWRFWQTKRKSGLTITCPGCDCLFRPKYTAEELYTLFQKRSNYANYNRSV